MLRHDKGYVLIACMVLLVLVSLLSLNALQTYCLAQKIQIEQLRYHDLLTQTDNLLSYLQLKWPEQCVFPALSVVTLQQLPITKWRVSHCWQSRPPLTLYYRIESMGVDACGLIHGQASQFFRISVLGVNDLSHDKIILQVIVAKASTEHLSCRGNYHTVLPGRIMWRQLI